jgi:hypothetical protein
MKAVRLIGVVATLMWVAGGAACDGGGGASDAGTESGGPIVIQATAHAAAESAETCGACHVVIDEVREDDVNVRIVPDVRLYLVHEQMMLAHELVAP